MGGWGFHPNFELSFFGSIIISLVGIADGHVQRQSVTPKKDCIRLPAGGSNYLIMKKQIFSKVSAKTSIFFSFVCIAVLIVLTVATVLWIRSSI